jgi:hypothetical protein
VGLLLLCCASIGAGANREDNVYTQLESESPEARAAASAEILSRQRADHEKVAAVVAKYAAEEGRGGTVKDSMLLLGKLRAAEHVPLLVRYLTFEVFYKNTKRPQTTEDLYPAVQALVDIGAPALRPVLERASKEDSETVQRTAAAVLRGVLGRAWATAVLSEEIRSAAQSQVKEKLERVLRQVQTLP